MNTNTMNHVQARKARRSVKPALLILILALLLSSLIAGCQGGGETTSGPASDLLSSFSVDGRLSPIESQRLPQNGLSRIIQMSCCHYVKAMSTHLNTIHSRQPS